MCIVCCKYDFNHAGTGVDGFGLVENKVADAVINGATLILFDGLQRVGVMANKDVGTCVYQ